MPMFPLLKSNAAAQYPVARTVEYPTEVLRFVDGTEQRFRSAKAVRRQWVIRLSLLEEEEIQRIAGFLRETAGRANSFSFTDPLSQTVYPNCTLESDQAVLEWAGDQRANAIFVIRENPA